jgi:hypothetical protein
MTNADVRKAQSKVKPDQPRSLFAIGVAGVLAMSLVVLGVPRSVAAWWTLPAVSTNASFGAGQTPTDDELAESVRGLERALAWVPSGPRFNMLAFFEIEQAVRLAQTDPRRGELFGRADEHFRQGLVDMPTDGFGWVRLAYVRQQRGGSGREVASALAQSLDVAPNVRVLWIGRAGMLLSYWRFLTVDEMLAFRDQLRTIWTAAPSMRVPLMQAALRAGSIPMVSWGIGDDPAGQAEFERLRKDLKPYGPSTWQDGQALCLVRDIVCLVGGRDKA